MTYWDNCGRYQEDYDRLFPQLVPKVGNADTKDGELLRSISKLYYDLFNNGWGNWDVLLKEREIIARFLHSTSFKGRINWNIPQELLPDSTVFEYENEIEKIADLIIKHIANETIPANSN